MDDKLIVMEKINPLALFTGGDSLDELLESIKEKATINNPDLKTKKGRKEIASTAYKVSGSKVLLDDARKKLVKDWKEKVKKVDSSGKKARDFLDNLRNEVRKPLTDWEISEEDRISKERVQKEYNQDWEDAHKEHDLFLRQKAIEKQEAQLAKEAVERKVKKEREAANRKAAQTRMQLAKEAEERDKRLQREAAEKATQEVKEKAKREREESTRKLQQEREARIKAERDKIAAEGLAKVEKELAVKQAREEAERKSRKEAEATEQKVREEKEKTEKAERDRIAAEEKKAKNRKHRKHVNNIVLSAFIENNIPENIAKNIIILVASGKISNITINY